MVRYVMDILGWILAMAYFAAGILILCDVIRDMWSAKRAHENHVRCRQWRINWEKATLTPDGKLEIADALELVECTAFEFDK